MDLTQQTTSAEISWHSVQRKPGSAVFAKGQRRLLAILNSAEQLVVDEGYARFSMRKVASNAGVSLAALQHYFPTLQLLIAALVRHLVDRYKAEISSLPDFSSKSPARRFNALVNYSLRELKREHNRTLIAELWAMALRDKRVAVVMDEMTEEYKQAYELAVAGINPKLSAAKRAQRAVLIVALIDGIDVFVQSSDGSHTGDKQIERGVRQHIRSIAMMP